MTTDSIAAKISKGSSAQKKKSPEIKRPRMIKLRLLQGLCDTSL